jgi:hypothetical protein
LANDSGLFHPRDDLERAGWILNGNVFGRGGQRMLPLYEAKMIRYFDHRYGTYEDQTEAQANVGTLPRLGPDQQDTPALVVLPRYWVAEDQVEGRLAGRWDRDWLLGWRDIARSTDERTVISATIPRAAAGDTWLMAFPSEPGWLLQASLSSFVLDYCARQKVTGTHLKYFVFKQLPVPKPDAFSSPAPWSGDHALATWVKERVLELSYTSYDMTPFAVDLGDKGPPFRWDEERRFTMRAELDAAFFHLYGIERDDVDYIMETFPVVKRRDIERFGSFRTKELALQVYDAMADAERTGHPYQSILDPPPGQGLRHPA